MFRELVNIANDMDKRGLQKEADALDRIISLGFVKNVLAEKKGQSSGLEVKIESEIESEYTDSDIEDATNSGKSAFLSTLSDTIRVILQSLEAESGGCAQEHLADHRDGNVRQSYVSFINCILNGDPNGNLHRDANIVLSEFRRTGIVEEEEGL